MLHMIHLYIDHIVSDSEKDNLLNLVRMKVDDNPHCFEIVFQLKEKEEPLQFIVKKMREGLYIYNFFVLQVTTYDLSSSFHTSKTLTGCHTSCIYIYIEKMKLKYWVTGFHIKILCM